MGAPMDGRRASSMACLNTDNVNVTGESFDLRAVALPADARSQAFTAAYFDGERALFRSDASPTRLFWKSGAARPNVCCRSPSMRHWRPHSIRSSRRCSVASPPPPLHRLGLRSAGEETGSRAAGEGRLCGIFLAETKLPYEQAWFDLHGGRPADRGLRAVCARRSPGSNRRAT